MKLQELVRPNILRLTPYSCARNEFNGMNAHVFLDANENPYNANLNRYPDPLQEDLKKEIAKVKGVPAENIFLGNGLHFYGTSGRKEWEPLLYLIRGTRIRFAHKSSEP